MRCESLSLELAGVVDGAHELPLESGRHLESCLRCQAELVQYRKLLRALTELRGELIVPDEALLDDILDAVRPLATVHRLHRRNRRVAYIGGIAAAAATAGAAGAIVIASRLANKHGLAS